MIFSRPFFVCERVPFICLCVCVCVSASDSQSYLPHYARQLTAMKNYTVSHNFSLSLKERFMLDFFFSKYFLFKKCVLNYTGLELLLA